MRPKYLQPAKYGQVLGNPVGRKNTGVRRLITYRPNQQLSEESKAINAKLNKSIDYYINNGCETPPTIVQLLTWIGLNNYQKRDSVTSDFISAPEGLAHLITKDADGIDAGCHNYQKKSIVRERFTMNKIQVKRLKALIYWVQDCHICQDNYDSPDVITQQQFLNDVDESLQRHGTRKKAAETGKQTITNNFEVNLKKHPKWQIWEHTLQDILLSIIGINGVPLSYVIMAVDAPNYAGRGNWEEKAIFDASLTGKADQIWRI